MPLRSVWCALWQAALNPNPNPSLNPKGRAVRVLGRRQPSRQRHQEVAARATPTSRPVGGCVDTRLSSPSPGASTPRVPASCMPWVGDYCTYGPRVPAFLCGARTGGTGQLALGGGLLYVRVPASGDRAIRTAQFLVPWHPRSEAPSRPPFDPWEEQQGQSAPLGTGPARPPAPSQVAPGS